MADPVEANIRQDDDEADERNDIADTGTSSISNGALNRREDGSAGDAHDEDTGTATGVAAEVGSTESEDGWVHRSLEEEDGDKRTDG